ncbi:MAG: hydrogenase [Rhodoferax sp.]
MELDTVSDTTTDSVDAAPLLRQLVQRHGASWVDQNRLAQWLQRGGQQVLFFAGDTVRFPESLDVAVVLPELQQACAARGQAFDLAVAVPAGAQALALSFGSQRWPTLMFFRDAQYSTTLSGMHDWQDFQRLVLDALQMPPGRVPGVGIAVVGSNGAGASCH